MQGMSGTPALILPLRPRPRKGKVLQNSKKTKRGLSRPHSVLPGLQKSIDF